MMWYVGMSYQLILSNWPAVLLVWRRRRVVVGVIDRNILERISGGGPT